MAVDHYENFPVASLLMPRRLRQPVRDIYRFARTADDIADEGDASGPERLERLAQYHRALDAIAPGRPELSRNHPLWPVFGPLQRTVARLEIPEAPFRDLLSAFEQDVATTRYATYADLVDYCRRSADPVGRLMLHLYGADTEANRRDADAVCTGLQLTNFWQDVAIDWQKGRVYLPQEDLARFGVGEAYIEAASAGAGRPAASGDPAKASHEQDRAWQALMRHEVDRARRLLEQGRPLARRLPGRLGLELKLIVLGGLRILERLDQLHYDVFSRRPTLTRRDWVLLCWRMLK